MICRRGGMLRRAPCRPKEARVSKQTDYTLEEWATLTSAPPLASMVVSMADLSGPIGLLQEAAAGFKAAVAALESESSELVQGVAASVKSGMRPDLSALPKERAALRGAILDHCRAAVAIVAAKSPLEAESYGRWILSIAAAAAEGAKEGSFLGLGGTRVSNAEAQVLRELAIALGVDG
jgi:hypothetical protein